MADIVEELRGLAKATALTIGAEAGTVRALATEAADEIERLREQKKGLDKEVERLRSELQRLKLSASEALVTLPADEPCVGPGAYTIPIRSTPLQSGQKRCWEAGI